MSTIWAISDIHLPGISNITMDKYGDIWKNHEKVIFDNVTKLCKKDDLLLIPGDISWAKNIEEAKNDFEYLSRLPCRVLMCSGNHDQWSKVPRETIEKALPTNVTWINDICFRIGNVAVVGCCFWEFLNVYPWPNHYGIDCNRKKMQRQARIDFDKALKMIPSDDDIIKILMLHFPPISYDARPFTFSTEISEKNFNFCVFGHAHNVTEKIPACDADIDGTHYYLCSCDWLKMMPIKICEFVNDSMPLVIDEKGNVKHL